MTKKEREQIKKAIGLLMGDGFDQAMRILMPMVALGALFEAVGALRAKRVS